MLPSVEIGDFEDLVLWRKRFFFFFYLFPSFVIGSWDGVQDLAMTGCICQCLWLARPYPVYQVVTLTDSEEHIPKNIISLCNNSAFG